MDSGAAPEGFFRHTLYFLFITPADSASTFACNTAPSCPKFIHPVDGHICFNTHVALPENVDTEFACAGYRGDLLWGAYFKNGKAS